MAVFGYGRTPRHDFGIRADKFFARYALFHFQQVAETVKVVKVFEQGKVERSFYVFVFFGLREDCR